MYNVGFYSASLADVLGHVAESFGEGLIPALVTCWGYNYGKEGLISVWPKLETKTNRQIFISFWCLYSCILAMFWIDIAFYVLGVSAFVAVVFAASSYWSYYFIKNKDDVKD